MGKILIFFGLCAFIPFAHSGTWIDARNKFNDLHESSLLDSARQIIRSRCGGSWMDNLMGEADNGSYLRRLRKCEGSMTENEHTLKSQEYMLFEDQTSRDKWKQVFPEYEEDIQSLSQAIEKHKSSDYFSYIKAHPKADSSGSVSDEEKEASEILLKSSFIGLFKEDAFYHARQEFLKAYNCVDKGLLEVCYKSIPESDRQCIDNYGFTRCRAFLGKNNCNKDAVLALRSELSQEDKTGMTYVCWKAATQGAQCCMNPDQCPTDSAFRSIAAQLQKAAPGLVQSFAGLEAMKGDYQKACEMNLMANAAGPLAQLKTKTCGDSVDVCEKTCDKKVQEFKENFKLAVLGRQNRTKQKQGQKLPTIDDIVGAARAMHKDDSDSIPSTEEEIEEIKTCSQAVVYLDNLFKDREKNKKSLNLSEKLSHASLVDCSGEVFKHSGGSVAGGANPMSGLGSMNPMAGMMCRQGNPNGAPPRFPVVGPTPNPGMGPGHLLGGKTIPGPGGNFVAPGTPGAPPDEFIQDPRGPAGTNALQGGWTDTGGSGMGPGGGPGGSGGGLTGSPSRDEGGGNEGTGDNVPMAYPEAFDSGSGGGFDVGGGDMSSEDAERLRMAQYMEKKDKEEEHQKEEERLKEIDAQGSIFNRISQTIQEWCEKEGCLEE